MPESRDVHTAIAVIDAMDDSVGTDDDLPNGWIIEFRDDATQLGKLTKPFGVAYEKLTETDRPFWRIQ